ncbi:MAG: hypothetical protein V4638_05020 [Bacteroidota bacterium]
MKVFIASALMMLICVNAGAQSQGVAYTAVGKGVATTFVTDYHTLGINTSALGWKNEYGKRFTIGMTEFGFGMYSDSLDVTRLRKLYKAMRTQIAGNEEEPADWDEQKQYATDYLNKGVAIFANYNWGGFAFQNEKFGGIAVSVNENYQWYSKLSENTTDILFNGKLAEYFDSLTIVFGNDTSMIANGQYSDDTLNAVIMGSISTPLNLSAMTNGTEIRMAWNRFYNVGYGRKLFGKDSLFVLYGGIGGRYIQSMAMFDMVSDDDGLRMYSSVSPNFNIDYGSIANLNPSTYSQQGRGLPKSVGSGYGIDLSLSAILFNRLKIAVAANNIGSVTYDRNVYRVKDTLVANLQLAGLSEYNITQAVNQFLQDGGILELEGVEKYTINNAANLRIGASFDFGKIAKIGVDFVAPFNRQNPGSFANPVFSVGGEIRPVKWLAISAGYFGGGIYKNNMPVGINFSFKDGTYEFGISSYDALTFFMNNSNSISAAFGVARVRF